MINAVNTDNSDDSEYENSPLWNVQLDWSPSELTTLSVGYGERFFGAGPNLDIEHRVRNSSFRASYTRDITREAASLDGISALGENGNSTIGNTDSVNLDNANALTPLDEPFVDNNFELGYKLTGRRSDFIVDAVYSDQEPLAGRETRQSTLGRLVFIRKLSDFMSLNFQYEHQRSKTLNRPELAYIENKFGIKFIYNFDGNEQSDEGEFELE